MATGHMDYLYVDNVVNKLVAFKSQPSYFRSVPAPHSYRDFCDLHREVLPGRPEHRAMVNAFGCGPNHQLPYWRSFWSLAEHYSYRPRTPSQIFPDSESLAAEFQGGHTSHIPLLTMTAFNPFLHARAFAYY